MKKPIQVSAAADYYATPGARALAHGGKKNYSVALLKMARQMAELVEPGSKLVPLPSREGVATQTLIMANEIARLTGSEVLDVLCGPSRPSLYSMKKANVDDHLINKVLQIKLRGSPPREKVVLIDNVFDTGKTINAAAELFDDCSAVVFASVDTPLDELKHSHQSEAVVREMI